MKARRWLAALLAGTMVLGSVASVSAETLSGTSWWGDYQIGTDSEITGDGSWSYTIQVDELSDSYGAFMVELYDDDGKYLTTHSDRDAWFYDAEGNLSTQSDGSSGLPDAALCVVEITREGQNFLVEYFISYEDGVADKFYTVSATDTNFAETVYCHAAAQVGTYTVSDLTDGRILTDDESITINDLTAGSSVEFPITGVDGDLEWSISEDRVLTITGNGDYVQYNVYNEESDEYYDDTYGDWRDYSDYISSAYVDVTGITSMRSMFENCESLTSVTFSENTDTSNVTDMVCMFQNCPHLYTVDFTNVDTSSVTNMAALFNGCFELESVDVSGFDTSNVTCMGQMFGGCERLTSIDLSNFNTSCVTDMYQMFSGCAVTSLDLSSFDTTNVTNMEFLLSGCSSLNELIIPADFGANYAEIFVADDPSEECGAVVNLPSTDYFYWVDESGNTVTTVTLGSATAVTYTRYRETITGTSGDLSWEIDPNGVLTITGTGDYAQGETDAEYSATPNWWNYREYITSAVVNVSGITSTECMFFECYNMTSIDVTGLDMSSVTTMRSMFDSCNSLTEITGINSWDVSNVTDAAIMFWGNLALTSIDLSSWNTSSFEDISQMFENSTALTSVDISGWDTSNVTYTDGMFGGDKALTEVKVPANFVPQCWGVDLPYQYGCYWVNSNGDTVDYIEAGNESALTYTRCGEPIETISGNSWWEEYTVEESGLISDGTYSYVFTVVDTYGDCGFVVEVSDADNNYYITTTAGGNSWTANGLDDESNLGKVSASGLTNYSYQSGGKYAVEITKNGSEITFDYYQIFDSEAFLFMTYAASEAEVFDDDVNLRFMAQVGQFALDFQTGSYVSNNSLFVFDALNGTAGDLGWTLDTEGTLTIYGSGDYASYNEEYGYYEDTYASWRDYRSCIRKAVVDVTGITYTGDMFCGLYNMTEIDLSGLDTSNVTNMSWMFDGCSSLTTLNVSGFDTSNVTNMNGMFAGCSSLESLNLNSFNTSNVGSMYYMFAGCSSLTTLDLSGFDTSNVDNMSWMFGDCSSLTSLDISNFNTSNVYEMSHMFQRCSSLTSIDVSGFDTSNVQYFGDMFGDCNSLTSIDVSGFDTSSALHIDSMFDDCSSLTELDLSSFDTSKVTMAGDFLYGCDSLTLVKVSANFGYLESFDEEYTDTAVAVGSAKAEEDEDEEIVVAAALSDTVTVEITVEEDEEAASETDDAAVYEVVTDADTTADVVEIETADDTATATATTDGTVTVVETTDETTTRAAISLPSVSGYYWANANAETVTEIDPDLDSEMWYIRYADGETARKNYMDVAQDISNATVTLSATSYTYDGKAKTPAVSSVVYDGETLVSGTDYTVSYSNNTNAGTATVTITGLGDFAGTTATANFTITKASQTVTASAASSSITYGKTTTITASTTGDGAISYSSSDTSVATVDSNGKVTAKGAGTATITVTAASTTNYNKATKTVTITVTRASQTLSVSSSSVTLAVGKTSTPTVSGAKTTLSYKSSDTSVATVSSSGKITAKKVGTVTITVTAAQTSAYSKATATITVKVKPASTTVSSVTNTTSGVKITWKKVTGATGYYVYRSTSKNGTYTKIATIKSGSTVTYTNKTSGTYKVTSGKTYYYKVSAYASTGTASKSAAKSVKYLTAGKISSLTNTSSGITVKWSKVSGASGYYVYRKAGSGSYSKVKTIKSASTVSWTDTGVKSKNGTTYTYKVVPYSGSNTGSFTAKKTVRMTAVSLSSVKNSSSKKMTVKWAKNSKATGYQIQYSTSSSFASGNKTVTVSGASSTSKVISSLTKGKTYYVRIRTYKTVSGTKYYSAWSSKKSVKISK